VEGKRKDVRDAALTGYAAGAVAPLLATLIVRRVFDRTQLADIVMIYLAGIVVVAMRWSMGPALFAALLSVLAFDFFFIPPYGTLAVADLSHVATFAVMFLIAALINGLTKRVRDQAEQQIAAAVERSRLSALAQEAQLLVDAEQLRNSLLSSVSHDLRTPLAVITGTASALTDERLDPAVRRDLAETIVHEAERLNRLVRNLLDVTRLEAGALRLEKEWQPVEEVIGTALAVVDRLLGHRPVTTDIAPGLLAPFDEVLVQQVLVNLLENAAKYTGGESPILVSATKAGDAVEIVVADRGPGLPDGEETRIFEKFYRAEKGKGGGAGLGLTICKGVVTAHGGRIWAKSRDGGGAAFHFTLPAGTPPQLDLPDSPRATEGAGP
jgi:two-component system sensor histidine kinase KdpD